MGVDHRADEWLMREVALGRRDAMTTLLRRYANPLLTFIRRMIADRHRSEELFQEVFLAVWTGRGRYRYPRPFRPWLFGIAANKCRADFRRRRPELRVWDEPAAAVASGGPSPVETAIAAETAALVSRAVAELPVGQRTVLVLRVYNGLSYGEIAEAIGRSEATARAHMFHALKALRRYLEPRLRP